jgi:hypothetical protein
VEAGLQVTFLIPCIVLEDFAGKWPYLPQQGDTKGP